MSNAINIPKCNEGPKFNGHLVLIINNNDFILCKIQVDI